MDVNDLYRRCLENGGVGLEEGLYLGQYAPLETLMEVAGRITRECASRKFHLCSIINAKSGSCSEDCAWCAQSAHFQTGVKTHPLVPWQEAVDIAMSMQEKGVEHFSLVCSGRKLREEELQRLLDIVSKLRELTRMKICVSAGLLGKEELMRLKRVGVERYHCNLETSSSYFPRLCSTHGHADKIKTLCWAKEVGLEICSGGIIGMGESMEDRVRMAIELKELGVDSIPINILQPIPGTPLENTSALPPEDLLRTIAVFRLIHPTAYLRFAGGRRGLDDKVLMSCLGTGINAAIVGDLLTTLGAGVEEDKQRFRKAGYTLWDGDGSETVDTPVTDVEFDSLHIWHPYTSATRPLPCFLVERASGCKLFLEGGKEVVDGMSSWWCAIHGYHHPVLDQAIVSQLGDMAHVMFGGLTHRPAVKLARLLLEIAPHGLEHVFFADSGSVAVEVAMKMAVQYQYAKGLSKLGKDRTNFVTIRSGYHGDTWNAMSVCDPQTGMHSLFGSALPVRYFLPQPKSRFSGDWNPEDIHPLEKLMEEKSHELAALILEPIVQGAGGMWFYHPEYLRQAARLCREHGVLLILDEIATGFGRTGKLFACEHAGIVPDIMCLGKAITGGYMTFSAVLTSRDVASVISESEPFAFMHGPTFMGNPMACAVAYASVNLLLQSSWKEKVATIEAQLRRELEPARKLPSVKDVRVLGAIGVVETHTAVDLEWIQRRFVEEGVWIRPFGCLVYVMPPLVITSHELSCLTSALCRVLEERQVLLDKGERK